MTGPPSAQSFLQALQAAPAAPAGTGSPVHKRPRAAGQSANSQDALQAQQPTGGRADHARKPLVALSNAELTLAFVSQQDQLDQLQLQCAAVFRFASDNVFALRLLAAVDQWKADHRPGRPHPLGACATAVALAVLFGLSDAFIPPGCNEEAAKALQALVAELLAGEAAAVAREFSHCASRQRRSTSSWIVDLPSMAASFHFTMYCVSSWNRLTLNAWVRKSAGPCFARRDSDSKLLVFSVDLIFCWFESMTSATVCSSCLPVFPFTSPTMAAPFFLPMDDGHDVFSLLFMHSFDGALCSLVGEVLVVAVVVDNGIHHSRATCLQKKFLATVESFMRASGGQDRHVTWLFEQKVT